MVLGEKSSILGVSLATVLALTGVGIILFRVDPFGADQFQKAIFFTTLFVGLWGLSAIAIFFLRRIFSRRLFYQEVFKSSFWRGLFVAFLFFAWLWARKYL